MRPTHLKAALGDPVRNCLGMMQWRPRMIEQTRNSLLLKTRQPLVSDPTAHPEPPAYRRKRFLVPLHHHHKTHPLFHGTGLRPSHRQGPPCRPVNLLPMSPVYSVTYVAGQDQRSTFSHKGRREEKGGDALTRPERRRAEQRLLRR